MSGPGAPLSSSELPRAVFLIRQVESSDVAAIDVVQSLFPDKQTGLCPLHQRDRRGPASSSSPTVRRGKDLYKIAKQVEEAITEELNVKVVIGIGTIVRPYPGPGPGL